MNDPRAEAVLARLHREAARQIPGFIVRNLHQLPGFLIGRGIRFQPRMARFVEDQFISIGPRQGQFLYMLARAAGARSIVEFGTSFAVSTIYLACAVRDNGGGQVITTELVPAKIERARAHLEEAGVAPWVEIREGDARATLAHLEQPVDMALLDGFPTLAFEVLKVVEPHLRKGGVVVVDDVNLFKRDLQPLVEYVENPANGYNASIVAIEDGSLLAVRR